MFFFFPVNFLQKHRAKHPVSSRCFKFLWFRLVWCSLVPDRKSPKDRVGSYGCTPSKWPFTPWLINGGVILTTYQILGTWIGGRWFQGIDAECCLYWQWGLYMSCEWRGSCVLDVYWTCDCWSWIRMLLYNWMYLKMYALRSLSISWLYYCYFDINMLTDLRD